MDKFCSVYVSGFSLLDELINELNSLLKGEIKGRDILLSDYRLNVKPNDTFDSNKQKEFPDGFVYFQYYLEFDFPNQLKLEDCIEAANCVTTWLWKNNKSAIAVSDYEDSLVNNGGYKSAVLPFPR